MVSEEKLKDEPVDQETAEEEPAPQKKHQLRVYRSWCKNCGICAAFCPKGALEMGEHGPEWTNPEKCIGCRLCELRCPDFAIEVIKEDDDASDDD